MADGFWDALGTPAPLPGALPTGGTGADKFWAEPTKSQGQAPPGDTQTPVPESPGNPLSYVFGMAKNLVMDIPEAVKGLWAIGKATVEDGIALGQQLVPGDQSLEQRVAENGYNWGNIVKAAPHMLVDDYSSRYGFHGLDEMKDQLYSNPLSYVLDALMVGGAAATGAKTAGKLGLMSEEAVAAVRGIAPSVESAARAVGLGKPTTTTMGLTGDMGKVPVEAFATEVTSGGASTGLMNFATDVNPVKRIIKNTIINKVMTRTTEATQELIKNGDWAQLGINPENLGLIQQAQKRLQMADEIAPTMGATPGLRITRPGVEKFMVSRAARYISGLSKSDFYGGRNAMVASLRSILGAEEGKDWELVKNIMGTNDWFEATLRGETNLPTGVLPSNPIDFEANNTDIVKFSPGDPILQAVGVDSVARQEFLNGLQNFFNNSTDTPQMVFTSPHVRTPVPGENHAMRGTGVVANAADVPQAARELATRNNWKLLGVRNYSAEEYGITPWVGSNYIYDTGKGLADVNIVDQATYEAQRIVSRMNDHVADLGGVAAGYTAEAQRLKSVLAEMGLDDPSMLGPEDAAKLAQATNFERLATNVQEEIQAVDFMRKRVFDHPLRVANGVYETPWEEAASMAEKVDRLYNWSTEYNVQMMARTWHPDWVKGIEKADGTVELLRGPYTVAINRAFMPMKLEVLHKFMTWGQDKIAELIQHNAALGIKDTDSVGLNIAEMLSQAFRLPKKDIWDSIMTPTDKAVADAIYDAGRTGEKIYSPEVARRMAEMADEYATHGNILPEYRAMNLPINKPEEAAQVVVKRLMEKVRMNVLKGDVEAGYLEDWGWQNFATSVPQLPAYYPHLRPASGGAMWWKGSTMKAPTMQFQKGFKGYLMESGRVSDDVFKSYSFRAYQLLRHQELMDQFEMLRPMARKLSQEEMTLLQQGALKMDGQVLFSPDFAKKQLSLHSMMLDDIQEGMSEGLLYEDAARNALQGINDELQDAATANLTMGEVYALPSYVADQFKSGFLQGFSPARMRMFWDKPRDLWISSVLGLNPRWFIYRSMGNIAFAGISDPRAIWRMYSYLRPKNNDLIEMALKDAKFPDGSSIWDAISRGYASGEMQKLGFINAEVKGGRLGETLAVPARMRNWGSAADEFPRLTKLADAIYNSRLGRIPRGISSRMTRWVNTMEQAERRGIALSTYGKAVGSRWESNLKLAQRIAAEGVDEDLAARMMTQANWVLGNYTMLSPIERDVVRRFAMPFYPFYRHMVKYTLRMPWDHPVKTSLLNTLHQVDEDMGPHLPGYMGGAAYIGQIGGISTYWNTTHWNPLSEMALPESTPLNFIDPRLRMLTMAWTGTDEFNRPYQAANVYEAPNGVQMIRTSTGWQPFEGIQHEPWLNMVLSQYGGPGAAFMAGPLRGYNTPWWKAAIGTAGFTLTQRNTQQDLLRELEARQAAWSSTSAREVPMSYGA